MLTPDALRAGLDLKRGLGPLFEDGATALLPPPQRLALQGQLDEARVHLWSEGLLGTVQQVVPDRVRPGMRLTRALLDQTLSRGGEVWSVAGGGAFGEVQVGRPPAWLPLNAISVLPQRGGEGVVDAGRGAGMVLVGYVASVPLVAVWWACEQTLAEAVAASWEASHIQRVVGGVADWVLLGLYARLTGAAQTVELNAGEGTGWWNCLPAELAAVRPCGDRPS